MFHCLARASADLIIGGSGAARSRSAWRQAYRAVEHGVAKNACKDGRVALFPSEIRDFANAFVALQEKRHAADYDPYARLKKSIVVQDIATARQAILEFAQAPVKDRRAFCVLVILRPAR